jgi:hypothetical protein
MKYIPTLTFKSSPFCGAGMPIGGTYNARDLKNDLIIWGPPKK